MNYYILQMHLDIFLVMAVNGRKAREAVHMLTENDDWLIPARSTVELVNDEHGGVLWHIDMLPLAEKYSDSVLNDPARLEYEEWGKSLEDTD